MSATIGKNVSKNNVAVLSLGIPVGLTSTTILAAQSEGADERIAVIVHNAGNKDAWIKFQAATVDDDIKGFPIPAGATVTIMGDADIYTGEISAIIASGITTILYVTSY